MNRPGWTLWIDGRQRTHYASRSDAEMERDWIGRDAAVRARIGCGSACRVVGTNGGWMRCGADLVGMDGSVAPYLCGRCGALVAQAAALEGIAIILEKGWGLS